MQIIKATGLHRKSGEASWRDLRFFPGYSQTPDTGPSFSSSRYIATLTYLSTLPLESLAAILMSGASIREEGTHPIFAAHPI